MRLRVVLPAYNEEESLPALFEAFDEAFKGTDCEWHILVVDDGSKDTTVKVAQTHALTMPITVVQHKVNQGLGAALNTGLREASKDLSVDDLVVTMDADNTHPPSLIHAMVAKIESGYDLVIASRYERGGEEVGLTLFRKVLSRGASSFLKLCFRIPGARDCSCGFRGYRVSLLRRAFDVYGDGLVEQTGFVCMAEVLVKLAMIGARIGEVPLVLRYDLKGGASKMKMGRTIRQYFGLVRNKKRFAETAAKATAGQPRGLGGKKA